MPAAKKPAKRKPATRKPATRKATTAKRATAKKTTPAKKRPAVKAKSRVSAAKKAPAKSVAAKKPAKKMAAPKRKPSNQPIKNKLTKTQIFREIAERSDELSQKQVGLVFESLHELVQGALKKGGCGEFAIPNIGVKIRRVKKKATKARWGRNPATGEQVWIESKPARQVIKVTALKALKETIG